MATVRDAVCDVVADAIAEMTGVFDCRISVVGENEIEIAIDYGEHRECSLADPEDVRSAIVRSLREFADEVESG